MSNIEKYKIVESFTNGFAQKVFKLENGATVYINYGQDEIEFDFSNME